nr:hypothetical protein Iba_chr08cCG12500 [Ipomoea batatas]
MCSVNTMRANNNQMCSTFLNNCSNQACLKFTRRTIKQQATRPLEAKLFRLLRVEERIHDEFSKSNECLCISSNGFLRRPPSDGCCTSIAAVHCKIFLNCYQQFFRLDFKGASFCDSKGWQFEGFLN